MTGTNMQNPRSGGDRPLNSNAGQQGTQHQNHSEVREHHLDKTIEDSFPASDPPSTDPNPGGDE